MAGGLVGRARRARRLQTDGGWATYPTSSVRNLRIELLLKTANFRIEGEICECVTSKSRGVLSIHIFYRALSRASREMWVEGTPLFLPWIQWRVLEEESNPGGEE